MDKKILVAYATAAGSTGEVAEVIGKAMTDGGAAVDVRQVKEVTVVSEYHAVVLGTGIRAGQVYREAAAFVETHQQALSQMPVAYFVVCATMGENTEKSCAEASAYLDQLQEKTPAVEPVDKGLFGGVMDYGRLPLVLRLIIKAMKKPEGDWRDWEAIRTWATNLRPMLSGK
ncbi:MAG: flavodoxin [Chloroflexi bacterium]|nr:flavodoxin [Chloroflexota bacterium]